MNARRGYCFISSDPVTDRTKFGIIMPTGKSVPRTGLCVHHNATDAWYAQGEFSMEGKRVVFDRWSGRPFSVRWTDGKEYEFICVSQWAILATLDEEPGPQPGDKDFCGFCRGRCKGVHYISPATDGY